MAMESGEAEARKAVSGRAVERCLSPQDGRCYRAAEVCAAAVFHPYLPPARLSAPEAHVPNAGPLGDAAHQLEVRVALRLRGATRSHEVETLLSRGLAASRPMSAPAPEPFDGGSGGKTTSTIERYVAG